MGSLKQLLKDYRAVKPKRPARFGQDEKVKDQELKDQELKDQELKDKGKWYHWKNLKNDRRFQIAAGITTAAAVGLAAHHANKRGVFDSKKTRERKASEKAANDQHTGASITSAADVEEHRLATIAASENAKRLIAKEERNPADVAADYKSEAGFSLFDFGKKKKKNFNFGLSQTLNATNVVNEIKPEKRSKVKRVLYTLLKKAGVKLGDYVDYTLKQLISMTIRYLGPIVLTAVLFRYRKRVYKTLVSESDRKGFDGHAENIKKMGQRLF